MNKAKFLLFVSSAAMLLAACGGQGQPSSESSSESLPSSEPSSSSSISESSSSGEASTSSESSSEDSPLAPLQKAFEAFPVNYTAEFIIQDEEDDYHPTLMVGDGFLANRYMYQITGYGKIARDENTYHRFDHYRPDKVDPDKGRYFEESGRTDFTDEDLVETAAIKNYFDLSKFTVTKEGNFYTMDEDNIVGYLALVNTSMGYYMFGHGTAGLEITLDANGQIDQIRFWGVGGEDGEVDEDALWATIEFSNVGTTVDPLFFDTVASEDYDLTPSTEWLPRIGRDGRALYEGVEFDFTDMCISSYLGETPEKIFLNWNGNSLINFEVDDFSAFGDVSTNLYTAASFKAKIHGDNGHVVLTEVGDVEYDVDCIDVYAYEIESGEAWYYDFGDMEYARNNNGSKVTLLGATYEGGYKEVADGEDLVLTFSYVNCGEKYSIPVILPASSSEDLRSGIGDTFAEMPVGSSVNLSDLIFFHENGNTGCYLTEMSFCEEGESFLSLCEITLGEGLPLYSGNLGFEFFFYTEIPGDDGVSYPGVYAVVDLEDPTAEGFEEDYGAELIGNGYSFVGSSVQDGTTLYQYGKGDVALIYTEAFTSEGYAYYALEAANLGSPIEPVVYDWTGTYNIHFDESGANYALVITEDGATFNGEEITYEEDENRLSFQYNDWNIALQDNGDGTYWGLCTTSETEYELTVTKVTETEE